VMLAGGGVAAAGVAVQDSDPIVAEERIKVGLNAFIVAMIGNASFSFALGVWITTKAAEIAELRREMAELRGEDEDQKKPQRGRRRK
jgi:AmiR/NasT family two-component response regulator